MKVRSHFYILLFLPFALQAMEGDSEKYFSYLGQKRNLSENDYKHLLNFQYESTSNISQELRC